MGSTAAVAVASYSGIGCSRGYKRIPNPGEENEKFTTENLYVFWDLYTFHYSPWKIH